MLELLEHDFNIVLASFAFLSFYSLSFIFLSSLLSLSSLPLSFSPLPPLSLSLSLSHSVHEVRGLRRKENAPNDSYVKVLLVQLRFL